MINAVKELLSKPVAYHPVLARMTGNVAAAVMLSQGMYWQRIAEDKGQEWFWVTADGWKEQCGLSRSMQETAREVLRRSGFWFEAKKGIPAQLFFRIDADVLIEKIEAYLGGCEQGCGKPANNKAETPRTTTGQFGKQVSGVADDIESKESKKENILESSSTADAAAHAEPPQSSKSKTKKLSVPAAPKSDSEPKYNWTREAAKAFDEVASEQCQSNGIEYSPFNWRVCSERNFGHLKNLRVEAILPDLIAKRKQEGICTQISEADILKSLRRIFTEAWLFYHKKAQFVGGKMKYTPERIYIDYNEIKSQIIQRRANATNQRNTGTGYAPTAFNRGVGNIDPSLGF